MKEDKTYPDTLYLGLKGHTVKKQLLPDGESKELPLEPSLKLRNHSPTGFSWGYAGSGPAQLALALLYDVTSDPELSLSYYQFFKDDFVAMWGAEWAILSRTILDWLRVEEAKQIAEAQSRN